MKEDIPPPAEAATEVGTSTDDAPETLGTLAVMAGIVIAVLAAIFFLIGYYS